MASFCGRFQSILKRNFQGKKRLENPARDRCHAPDPDQLQISTKSVEAGQVDNDGEAPPRNGAFPA